LTNTTKSSEAIQAWIADILARLPDHPVKQIDELLPWTWNKARQLALAAAA
jgi:transposase